VASRSPDEAIRPSQQPTAAGGAALACRDLVKAYGDRTAVDGLSLTVDAGEAYGLLGPNGAGKSTTIRMICGLLRPDAGTVEVSQEVGGADGAAGQGAAPSLGYVPQELALFPTLSLWENLEFWGRMLGVERRERRGRIDEALESVGLASRAADRVDRTSGGMQRRLNLAAALVHRPKLLVLDEPTVGVDAQSRASLLETIGRLRDQGTAVLYTSHHLDEAERLCDRVGIIDHGRMLAEGEPAALSAERGAADLYELYLDLTGRDLRD
jgi:ABC-2 type transport system ATP-binding protein